MLRPHSHHSPHQFSLPPPYPHGSLWSPTHTDLGFFANDDFFLPDDAHPPQDTGLAPDFTQLRIRKTSLSAAWADLHGAIENGFTTTPARKRKRSTTAWALDLPAQGPPVDDNTTDPIALFTEHLSYSSLLDNFPLIPPSRNLSASSPDIYLTVVHAVPVFVTMCRNVFLLRRADQSQFVNASSLLIAGGIPSDRERSFILSLERARVRIHSTATHSDAASPNHLDLVGTWIPLPRARALAATCGLDATLSDFLSSTLSLLFPTLPPMTVPPSLQIHWHDDSNGCAFPTDPVTIAPATTIRPSSRPKRAVSTSKTLPRTGSSFAALPHPNGGVVDPVSPVMKFPAKKKRNSKDLVISPTTPNAFVTSIPSPVARDQLRKRKLGQRPKVVGVPTPESYYSTSSGAAPRPLLSSSAITGKPAPKKTLRTQPSLPLAVPDNDETEDEETESEPEPCQPATASRPHVDAVSKKPTIHPRVFHRIVPPVAATGRSLPVSVTEVQFDSNDSNFSSSSPGSNSDDSLDIVTPATTGPAHRTASPLKASVLPAGLNTITPPPTPNHTRSRVTRSSARSPVSAIPPVLSPVSPTSLPPLPVRSDMRHDPDVLNLLLTSSDDDQDDLSDTF